MRLSFIIPMYNAATSIEKCIVSTQTQDIPQSDYEVIVINDGSTDGSLTVAKELEKRYENVHVYSQSNGGLSAARNAGLRLAKGGYIFFLDSDDWILENCLNKIVSICEDNYLDMLRISAANVIDGIPYRRYSVNEGKIGMGVEVLEKGVSACAPFAIYNRHFLNKHRLEFYLGIYHEDNEFTPRAYYLAERVSAVNDLIYFVYQTPGSITRSVNVKKPLDITIVMQNLDVFCQKYVRNKDRYIFHSIIAGDMNSALHQTLTMGKGDRKKVNDAFYKVRHLFVHARKSRKMNYRLVGWLYTLFPHHVVEVYRALHFKI